MQTQRRLVVRLAANSTYSIELAKQLRQKTDTIQVPTQRHVGNFNLSCLSLSTIKVGVTPSSLRPAVLRRSHCWVCGSECPAWANLSTGDHAQGLEAWHDEIFFLPNRLSKFVGSYADECKRHGNSLTSSCVLFYTAARSVLRGTFLPAVPHLRVLFDVPKCNEVQIMRP